MKLLIFMTVFFCLMLAVLLAVLFSHPRFPEKESTPSLLNREPVPYAEDETNFDHAKLYADLKTRFVDLESFMDDGRHPAALAEQPEIRKTCPV